MNFLLSICAPPCTTTALQSLRFAEGLISQGHSISQLFFYSEGVLNSRQTQNTLGARWQKLIEANQLDAVCCANSATEFGVMDDQCRLSGFTIAGIAQLTTQALSVDRCLSFGIRGAGISE